ASGSLVSALRRRVSSATSRGSPTLRANRTTLLTPRFVSSASSGLGSRPWKPTQKRRAARASRAEGMESLYHPPRFHSVVRARSCRTRGISTLAFGACWVGRKALRVLNSCYAAVLCAIRGDGELLDPAAHRRGGARGGRGFFRVLRRAATGGPRRGDRRAPPARGEAPSPGRHGDPAGAIVCGVHRREPHSGADRGALHSRERGARPSSLWESTPRSHGGAHRPNARHGARRARRGAARRTARAR